MENCPRCGSTKFWRLSTGQLRCSHCGLTRRFYGTLWKTTRISPYWKGRLCEFFCLGVPAYRLRFQVPLDPKTIQRWFRILREAIYHHEVEALSTLSGEIEMDETMFGGRVPGKRGWGTAGKHMVFGIYQRNGRVLTFPVVSRGNQDLVLLMTNHTKAGSLYYTDDWHAYTFLDIHGNHVVIRKEKGNQKAEIILTASRGSGPMQNIGSTNTVEYPGTTSTSI